MMSRVRGLSGEGISLLPPPSDQLSERPETPRQTDSCGAAGWFSVGSWWLGPLRPLPGTPEQGIYKTAVPGAGRSRSCCDDLAAASEMVLTGSEAQAGRCSGWVPLRGVVTQNTGDRCIVA